MHHTKNPPSPTPITGLMTRLISHPRLKGDGELAVDEGVYELAEGEGVYDVGAAMVRECEKSVISVGTGTAVSSLKSLRSIGWE